MFEGIFKVPSVMLEQRYENSRRRQKKIEKMQEFRIPLLKVTQHLQRSLLHSVVKRGKASEDDLFRIYQMLSFLGLHHRFEYYELNMLDENEKNIAKLNEHFVKIFTYTTTPSLRIPHSKLADHFLGDAPFRFLPGEIQLMSEFLNYSPEDPLTILPHRIPFSAFRKIIKSTDDEDILAFVRKLSDLFRLKSPNKSPEEIDCSRLILVQNEAVEIVKLLDPKGIIVSNSKRYALNLDSESHRFPLLSREKEGESKFEEINV